jgi:hypothetical protein
MSERENKSSRNQPAIANATERVGELHDLKAPKPASAHQGPRSIDDLIQIVRDASAQALSAGYPSSIVAQALSLNSPHRFEVEDSLHPGRKDYSEPAVVVHKSRADGLAEIREHFLDRANEHTWIFLPTLGLWIDDCTRTHKHSVEADTFMRSVLLRVCDSVEVFHTHPDGLYRTLHEQGDLPAHYRIIAATPSVGDQLSAVLLENEGGSAASLKSHVISHFGVTSYQRTRVFRDSEDMIGGNFGWDYSLSNPSADPVKEIQRIIGLLQDKVASVQTHGPAIPTWLLTFEPFMKNT